VDSIPNFAFLDDFTLKVDLSSSICKCVKKLERGKGKLASKKNPT
jgi:hypothetical protein